MFKKSRFSRILSLSLMITSMAVFAFGDTIRLKDGSIIKGKIISFESGQFVITVGNGERERKLTFFADEIETINFNSGSIDVPDSDDSSNKSPGYTTTQNNGSTVITLGKKSDRTPTSNPVETETPKVIATSTQPSLPKTKEPKASSQTTSSNVGSTNPMRAQPIRIRTKVLADNTSNGWTNSGWVVSKGQKISISGTGRVSIGGGRYSSPNGISSLPDAEKLIKDKPTGALIAVIGDDNNNFIYVGDRVEFVANRDGALFLGINEGNLDDNTGAYEATVEVDLDITN